MGYTTTFEGSIEILPPLNPSEVEYLRKFATTRRMHRSGGPYFVDGLGFMGQEDGPDEVYDHNQAPPDQPGLWCQWVPSDDGAIIEWDEGEKFYYATEWMAYIIDHFLRPGAKAFSSSDPQFNEFTFDHHCNGVIYAQGEDPDDMWALRVKDNEVSEHRAHIAYEGLDL